MDAPPTAPLKIDDNILRKRRIARLGELEEQCLVSEAALATALQELAEERTRGIALTKEIERLNALVSDLEA